MAWLYNFFSKWKTSILRLVQDFKLLLLGIVSTIQRSFAPIIKYAAAPGALFAIILLPFISVSKDILAIDPYKLLMGGLYVARPYSMAMNKMLPGYLLAFPLITLLKFILFFATLCVPLLIIRTSRERKNFDYIMKNLMPSLMLWILITALNFAFVQIDSLLSISTAVGNFVFTLHPVMINALFAMFGAWLLALSLNLSFFMFDRFTAQAPVQASYDSVRNTALAGLYFMPVFLIPWPTLVAHLLELFTWLIEFLPIPLSLTGGVEFVQEASPMLQQLVLAILPCFSVILAATLNLLSFAFYATLYLKMKHDNPRFFFAKAAKSQK